jgi:hypothetical protein
VDDERTRRKRLFFRIRVGVLLFVLFVVVLYTIRDIRSRRARNEWDHTLAVAVVLLREGDVDAQSVEALRARAPALADRLAGEMRRYRPGTTIPPFRFKVFGPIDGAPPPPVATAEGAVDLAKQSVALAQWVREVDPRAGVDPDLYDTRIYVTVRRARANDRAFIEGQSEENGRIGVVQVDLDAAMVDLALFGVAHELMHTLGASDRYDARGRTIIPDGLPEPDRGYPQRFAEIMARNRVIAPNQERVPDSIDEIAVGRTTAIEIGWIKK